MYWKDLPKKDKKHLRRNGITTKREFLVTRRRQRAQNKDREVCHQCSMIAWKLGVE